MCLVGVEFFIDFTAENVTSFYLNRAKFFRKIIVLFVHSVSRLTFLNWKEKKLAFSTCPSLSFFAQKETYLGQKNCNTNFVWRRLFFT